MKFNVNYEYVISQVNDTELIITDQSINESYTVPIKSIKVFLFMDIVEPVIAYKDHQLVEK